MNSSSAPKAPRGFPFESPSDERPPECPLLGSSTILSPNAALAPPPPERPPPPRKGDRHVGILQSPEDLEPPTSIQSLSSPEDGVDSRGLSSTYPSQTCTSRKNTP